MVKTSSTCQACWKGLDCEKHKFKNSGVGRGKVRSDEKQHAYDKVKYLREKQKENEKTSANYKINEDTFK